MFSFQSFALVMCGGGLGAAARYAVTTLVGMRFGAAFPFGTLAVNVVGSFLMGALMMFAIHQRLTLSEPVRLFFAVGFLGGFTTFSSFSMETLTLLEDQEYFYACGNMLLNVLLGILAAGGGCYVIRSLA